MGCRSVTKLSEVNLLGHSWDREVKKYTLALVDHGGCLEPRKTDYDESLSRWTILRLKSGNAIHAPIDVTLYYRFMQLL